MFKEFYTLPELSDEYTAGVLIDTYFTSNLNYYECLS